MYSSIRPGRVWLDTDGNRIQAHGGSIITVGDRFYWYGENKSHITGRATGIYDPTWHHGVNLYSSSDLYNWTYEGVIMVDEEDPKSLFHPSCIMDRPHILYCDETKEFVLWAKCCPGGFNEGVFGICKSKSIKGPFVFSHALTCEPYHVGDFDLLIDGGEGYAIFEHPHTKMISWKLNATFDGFEGEPKEHLPRPFPPFTREAPAYFEHEGVKYLLTSGTTGYYPNPSEVCRMNGIQGEWEDLGDPCIEDFDHNSFHAQFSSVFHHPKIKDLYIALGDRWLTDLYRTPNMQDLFEREFNPEKEPLPEGVTLDDFTDQNTSEANYVWLPIEFEQGKPVIRFRSSYTIEEFIK